MILVFHMGIIYLWWSIQAPITKRASKIRTTTKKINANLNSKGIVYPFLFICTPLSHTLNVGVGSFVKSVGRFYPKKWASRIISESTLGRSPTNVKCVGEASPQRVTWPTTKEDIPKTSKLILFLHFIPNLLCRPF